MYVGMCIYIYIYVYIERETYTSISIYIRNPHIEKSRDFLLSGGTPLHSSVFKSRPGAKPQSRICSDFIDKEHTTISIMT